MPEIAENKLKIMCGENIDAIRASMGFSDAKKSMDLTNKALGIDDCKDCTYNLDE